MQRRCGSMKVNTVLFSFKNVLKILNKLHMRTVPNNSFIVRYHVRVSV